MSLPTNFFMGKGGGGGEGLYSFTTYTFNEPHASRFGTPYSTFQSRYAGEPFMTKGYLIEGQFTGYQRLTLPYTGTYRFELAGAPGARAGGTGNAGHGRAIRGDMSFVEGDEIQFLIGKSGSNPDYYNAGGGGGTFIVKQAFWGPGGQTNANIVGVAGGGAGGGYLATGRDATFYNNGVAGQHELGGSNGNGGNTYSGSGGCGGGAGIFTGPSGSNGGGGTRVPALPFTQGGVGGRGYYNNNASGFGGGGESGNHGGGPGGGYSGGGAGSGNAKYSGGGGSYWSNLGNYADLGVYGAIDQTEPEGGYVKITYLGE